MDERARRELVTTRRLYIIWAFLGVLVLVALCYLVSAMLRARTLQPVSVGAVDDFPRDSVTLRFVNADFNDPTTQKQFTTLSLEVVRASSGDYSIFFARSTDPSSGALTPRQCVVLWDDAAQQFQDACGGSKWARDGKYIVGPAPRDLDRFPTQIVGGQLQIQLDLIAGAAHP